MDDNLASMPDLWFCYQNGKLGNVFAQVFRMHKCICCAFAFHRVLQNGNCEQETLATASAENSTEHRPQAEPIREPAGVSTMGILS